MTVLASKNEIDQPEETQRAAQRFGRMFLILSFGIFGVAVTYFGALYLIAH